MMEFDVSTEHAEALLGEEVKTVTLQMDDGQKTLKVEGLENARRMHLIVKDGGDKNQDDLADWVDGKLFLK